MTDKPQENEVNMEIPDKPVSSMIILENISLLEEIKSCFRGF